MRQPDWRRFVTLVLLVALPLLLMAFAGFSKPRSFCHLALLFSALLALQGLYLSRHHPRRAAVYWVLVLCAELAVLPSINGSVAPFKRTSIVPYAEIMSLIDSSERRTVVVTPDPVLRWVIHEQAAQRVCVMQRPQDAPCDTASATRLIVVSGRVSAPSLSPAQEEFVRNAVAGAPPAATAYYGTDREARFKTRLSGVELDAFVLQAQVYELRR